MLRLPVDAFLSEIIDHTRRSRAVVVTAIGRGVGRAAVHEFVHQMLGSREFDATKDPGTYEFGSAARKEQYYGPMHWGPTRLALDQRFGSKARP